MATLLELANIGSNPDYMNLKKKITIAVTISAEAILDEPPSSPPDPARQTWAIDALSDPSTAGDIVTTALIAESETSSIETILAASDATIKTKTAAMINTLIEG